MATQDTATGPLSLSPIRANFQGKPEMPRLYWSSEDTPVCALVVHALTNAHVQIIKSNTDSKLGKSNKADCKVRVRNL